MKKLILIYLTALILLQIPHYLKLKSTSESPLSIGCMSVFEKAIDQHFTHTTQKKLMKAYILGQTNDISPATKSRFRLLGLLHLFTPSGVHLSAFLILFSPLKKLLQKKKYKIVIALILIATLFLPTFYALKRMSLFRLINLISIKRIEFNLILSFLVDFILGNYFKSPYSFSLSFLFLSILIFLKDETWLRQTLALIGAQVLISIVFGQNFSMIGFLFGILLTAIFTLLFPFILIAFFLFPLFPFLPLEKTGSIFYQMVCFAYQWSKPFSQSPAQYTLVIILFLSLIPWVIHFANKLKKEETILKIVPALKNVLKVPQNL